MKRTYPKHIAAIIEESMAKSGLTQSFNEQRAASAWAEVVGPAINRYTLRRYVDHGVLHVFLSSAPLKNELSFTRERLIEALNTYVGADAITDIRFH